MTKNRAALIVAACMLIVWICIIVLARSRDQFIDGFSCSENQERDCERARAYVAADFAFSDSVDPRRDSPPDTGLPYGEGASR